MFSRFLKNFKNEKSRITSIVEKRNVFFYNSSNNSHCHGFIFLSSIFLFKFPNFQMSQIILNNYYPHYHFSIIHFHISNELR